MDLRLFVSLLLILVSHLSPLAIAAVNPSMINPQGEPKIEEAAPELPVHRLYEYKDKLRRDTPRGTLEGFSQAAYEQDFELAAKYLDLRYLPEGMTAESGAEYASKLQAIIDRNVWVDLDQINDSPRGLDNDMLPAYRDAFGRIQVDGGEVSLLLQRVPGKRG